jgi:uncharacterized membrane protein
MRIILSVLLLLLQNALLQAGTISGYIRDEQGKPLAYASVYVKNGRAGTTSGANGYYQLNLTAGTYTLVAQHVGYAKKEQAITVENDPIKLNFHWCRPPCRKWW